MTVRFVGPGRNIKLRDGNGRAVRHVIWGDFLNVDGREPDGRLRIIWGPRGPNPQTLFIDEDDTVEQRPLEIVFVDVGQGDGAVLITPERGEEERIVVIDAGEGDNMARFLNGRFRTSRGFGFDAAVITHPDLDHYQGFQAIFEDHRIGFDTVYHSGLVERPVSGTFAKIGPFVEEGGVRYFTDLAVDRDAIERHFGDDAAIGQFKFPGLMNAALHNSRIRDFRMLSTAHGTLEQGACFMPGFSPSDGRPYTIEVVGPVVEPDAAGNPRLRRNGSYGETKNGHSVLLKLRFGDFTVLFGGDLNDKAEKFLLRRLAGLDRFPREGTPAYRDMIDTAAATFRADVMKVCHHGSEKVTDAFLETVNPAAFIISSGDEEGHVHPRPDLLGRLGRFGRGSAPVLLSTELQRSTRETETQDEIDALKRSISQLAGTADADRLAAVHARVDELGRTNVQVYGAIYLKTDGERLITAFRIETGSATKRWFYFEYEMRDGELVLVD